MAAIDDILGNANGGGKKDMIPSPNPGFSPDLAGGAARAPQVTQDQDRMPQQKGVEEKKYESVGVNNDVAENAKGMELSAPQTDVRGLVMKAPDQLKTRRMSYVDLHRAMNPDAIETPEQKEAREKKEKRQAIFSALGDGISALSNLYFTTQYAPNAYDASQGLSAKARERWDKLNAQREARRKEYYEGYVRAQQLDDANERDDRNWNHTLEREKKADEYRDKQDRRAEAKAERDDALAQLRLDLMQGKIDEQTAAAQEREIKAKYAGDLIKSQIAKNNRSGTGSRGGGGGQKTALWIAYDEKTGETKTIYATSEANAWSQVPQGYTIRKAPSETTTKTTTTDSRGRVVKSQDKSTIKNESGKTGGYSTGNKNEEPEFDAKNYKRNKSAKSGGSASRPPLN